MPRINERNLLRTLFNVSRKEGQTIQGQRYIQWNFITDLKNSMVEKFMEKINANVQTSFYLRHTFEYVLQNIEDESWFVYYYADKKDCGSPWFNQISDARKWFQERERFRLDPDNIDRPNTKWIFVEFFKVSLKVVSVTDNHLWATVFCLIGLKTLLAAATNLFVWMVFLTICVFGVASQFIKVRGLTEALKKLCPW